MAVQLNKRLFTVEDYYRMADAGILRACERVELIEGEVIAVSSMASPHAAAVGRATRAMFMSVGLKAIIRTQLPVRLDEYSEPEPDLALLRSRDNFYSDRHPLPPDVLLIVEVSDSSLEYDRNVKGRIYAGAGITEYWISDIIHDCLLIHSDLRDKAYRSIRELHRGEAVAPQLLPECSIRVADLLP